MRIDVTGAVSAEVLGIDSLVGAVRAEPGLSAVAQPVVSVPVDEVDPTPASGSPWAPTWSSASVIVGLTSSGLVSVLVRVVLGWLARFSDRDDISVSITVGGKTLEISPSDVRDQVVERVTALIGDRDETAGDHAGGDEVTRDLAHGVTGGDLVVYDDRLTAEGGRRSEWPQGGTRRSQLPVTVYLSEERDHDRVEAAVEDLLSVAGLRISKREDPVIGSWFRRMWAGVAQAARSPITREAALTAAHAAEGRFVLAQDAAITATLMQNLGPLIGSLDKTKDAVIRVGAVLVVKVDWKLAVYQLTPTQQFLLDRQPDLAMSPENIARALSAQPAHP